jgi:3-oxoacyl-[acyl-carrier protein] reductase
MTMDLGLGGAAVAVNGGSKGGRHEGYLAALPPERSIDPDDLHDAMKVIAEDFGHPANLGRAGDPHEIGPVIAFVASRVNSYMTGADINVDGGSDF